MWKIHFECDKFAHDGVKVEDAPKSVGHFLRDRFDAWLKNEKAGDDPDTRAWRRQLFQWWVKWEECDSGCDDLFRHSSISWGQYVDYEEDTSFANGYSSVLDVMVKFLDQCGVRILLGHEVDRVDYDGGNASSAVVYCKNGVALVTDHVLSTLSLGVLKANHESLFHPALPTPLQDAIESISFGTIDRVKLDFEEIFWNEDDPGLHVLWSNNSDSEDEAVVDKSNWFKSIYGFDEVINQPTILMGWISGEAARFMEAMTDDEIAESLTNYLQTIMRKHKADPEWRIPKLNKIIVTR